MIPPGSTANGAAASAGLATGGAAVAALERVGDVPISPRHRLVVSLNRNEPYGKPRLRLQLEILLDPASWDPRTFIEVPMRRLPELVDLLVRVEDFAAVQKWL